MGLIAYDLLSGVPMAWLCRFLCQLLLVLEVGQAWRRWHCYVMAAHCASWSTAEVTR